MTDIRKLAAEMRAGLEGVKDDLANFHERIWLQHPDDADPGTGPLWAEDKVWPINSGEQKPCEYVRADLFEAQAAEIARLNSALNDAADKALENAQKHCELADKHVACMAEIAALKRERDEARAAAGLGCDAANGGSHTVVSGGGTYRFCSACGETIKSPDLRERARKAETRADTLARQFEEAVKALRRIAEPTNPERLSGAHLTPEGRGQLAFAMIDNFQRAARAFLDQIKGGER